MMPSPTDETLSELSELIGLARSRVSEMPGRIAAKRREATARVIRWQWAAEGSQLHRMEPLVREREDLRRSPKLLSGPPGELEDAEQYGYDASGRIVVAREAHNPDRRSRYCEHLICYSGRYVESWSYWSDGQSIAATVCRTDEHDRLRLLAQANAEGSVRTGIYVRDADRVTEIHSRSESPAHGGIIWSEVEEVEYDAGGRLSAIYSTWRSLENSGDRELVWRARSAGPSQATLARRIGESLGVHLPAVVCSTVAFVPWAAVLYFDSERPLHGSLVIAGATVRDCFEAAARASGADDWARLALWNPAEWLASGSGEVEQIAFDELASDLSALIVEYEAVASDDHEAAVKLVRRVAKRLYADLPKACKVAPGFVAYPLDVELTELPKGLRATVPPEVLAAYEHVVP